MDYLYQELNTPELLFAEDKEIEEVDPRILTQVFRKRSSPKLK